MDGQLVNTDNTFYVLLIGSIVPVAGYMLNRWPWYKGRSEQFKGIVQFVLTTVAGYIYSASVGADGFINLSEGAFSSLVASAFAHNILWKPSGVNVKLGATASAGQQPAPVAAEAVAAATAPAVAAAVAQHGGAPRQN